MSCVHQEMIKPQSSSSRKGTVIAALSTGVSKNAPWILVSFTNSSTGEFINRNPKWGHSTTSQILLIGNSDKKIRSMNQLVEYKSYKENWNGYGGKPFSETIIAIAEDLLRRVGDHAHVSPTGRGTIQFDFFNNEDSFEAEIFEDHVHILEVKGENEAEDDVSPLEFINRYIKFYA